MTPSRGVRQIETTRVIQFREILGFYVKPYALSFHFQNLKYHHTNNIENRIGRRLIWPGVLLYTRFILVVIIFRIFLSPLYELQGHVYVCNEKALSVLLKIFFSVSWCAKNWEKKKRKNNKNRFARIRFSRFPVHVSYAVCTALCFRTIQYHVRQMFSTTFTESVVVIFQTGNTANHAQAHKTFYVCIISQYNIWTRRHLNEPHSEFVYYWCLNHKYISEFFVLCVHTPNSIRQSTVENKRQIRTRRYINVTRKLSCSYAQ